MAEKLQAQSRREGRRARQVQATTPGGQMAGVARKQMASQDAKVLRELPPSATPGGPTKEARLAFAAVYLQQKTPFSSTPQFFQTVWRGLKLAQRTAHVRSLGEKYPRWAREGGYLFSDSTT